MQRSSDDRSDHLTAVKLTSEAVRSADLGEGFTEPAVEDTNSFLFSQVVSIPIQQLMEGDSPRLNGIDADHVHMLAQIPEELPPIVVNESTMHVIDGMHRLRVAQLKGEHELPVRFFRGSEFDAYRIAVKANVTHGLPLTLADRRRAADRIIRAEPRLSDRAVALTVGLAASTIAGIRADLGASVGADKRVGRDGRTRPLSAADGRRIASQLIAQRPQASIREIAREAGISLGTAHDVRARIRAGCEQTKDARPARRAAAPLDAGAVRSKPAEGDGANVDAMLSGLRRDPSLRYSEAGRAFLRFFSNRIVDPTQLVDATRGLPPHCSTLVSRIARQCAQNWLSLAEALEGAATVPNRRRG